MHDLNYQHLRYFWMVARETSLTAAAKRLRLAPSTVSAQIKSLEQQLGHPLFVRRGRGLDLTEHGVIVKQYADDIFSLGEELVDATREVSGLRHAYRLRAGVGNNVPKWVAHRFLAPALCVEGFPVHLVVLEDHADRLVTDLAVHHLDLVLSDAPVRLAHDVDADSQLLGESNVSMMGTKDLADAVREGFPESLHASPVLLPDQDSTMRRLLDGWFEQHDIRPHVVAEFGDSALLKVFGQGGAGIFPVPSVVAQEVSTQYHVETIGELDGLRERFYAITPRVRRTNPAVRAVLERARAVLD